MKNDDVYCCDFYLSQKREENTGKIAVEWNLALAKFLTAMDDVTDRHVFEILFEYLCKDFDEYETSILNKYCDFGNYLELKEDIKSNLIDRAKYKVSSISSDSWNNSDIKEYRDFLTMIVNNSNHEYDFEFLYFEFKNRWNKWREDKSNYNYFNDYFWSHPKNDWVDIIEVLETGYSVQGLLMSKEEEYLDKMFGPNSEQYLDTE